MATPGTRAETTLEIRRTFQAPREKVFEAWTRAEALKRWFAPSPEFTVEVTALDLRVGGHYRIEMRHSAGNIRVVGGVYREISPPERLEFTWAWEDDPGMGDTLVAVELHARGNATELVLTHELFPSAAARDEHGKGWKGCLDRLVQAL